MKLNPNDLDKISTLEACQKIDIDHLVRDINKSLKKNFIESEIETLSTKIKLTTTKTRFKGEKYWFVCPSCQKRRGVLYKQNNNIVGCRNCLGLLYSRQKYRALKIKQS